MREYVKHSLYDKVSTRPFLTTLEKKWITFQVLCALHQCHKQKICHGDIKVSVEMFCFVRKQNVYIAFLMTLEESNLEDIK